jgi:dienelactone hydrolase
MLAIASHSCTSGNSDQAGSSTDTAIAPTITAYDSTLAAGKVADSAICKTDRNQTYALYLPSYYSADKQCPIIYFFDAHGRGSLPVNSYKNLAEKYGFVLAGSNNSRNGTDWQATRQIVRALMDDTRSRINIDPKRVYTSGFSGGSRVAVTVAIAEGGIAGVLGCAAGFPREQQAGHNKFDYFGMVGDFDFNLTEMEQWDATLAQNGYTHQLLTSSGKHGWPSEQDFNTALLWIQANAIKVQVQPKNDTLIATLKNDYESRIAAATKTHDWIKAHELADGEVRLLDGLTDVSACRRRLAEIVAGKGYKAAAAMQETFRPNEAKEQQELGTQFTKQSKDWWAKKIADLNQKTRNTKDPKEAQMYGRLLSYLGFVSYMNASHAIKTGDLTNAANYLQIFKIADPKNADCPYLTAIYYIAKGDTAQAMASLKEATTMGYNEIAALLSEPAFTSLHTEAAFLAIAKKASTNNTRKE